MRKTLFFLTLLVMFSVVLPCRGQGLAESVDSNQTGVVAWALQQYDQHMGYPAVGVLMAVESSFIPFPSELVIPPAVYVSFDETSRSGMTWWLIVVIGTLGALIGAYINYFLSLWLGRPIIYAFVDSRWGHMLGLSGEKMERAERYFNDHGVMSTLVGRLIPVIRQLISIPAGLSKMNLGLFTLYTTLGAAIWNMVLAGMGWLAFKVANPSMIKQYSDLLSYIIMGIVVVAVVVVVVRHYVKKRKQ